MGEQPVVNGLVAVVTGAAGGIGGATAVRLARAGARLVLADIDVQGIQRQLATLPSEAVAIALYTDVTRRDSLDQLAARAVSTFGQVDVVVNCAGIVAPGPVIDLSESAVRRQIEVNLLGTIFTTQAFLPLFRRQDSGHLIHLASLGGVVPMPGEAVYCATKYAVRGFCFSLALELRNTPIRVSVISPDSVRTRQLELEAREGGSTIAFTAEPMESGAVADAIVRTIRRPRLDVGIPATRAGWAKLLTLSPALLWRLYPMFDRIGRHGRERFSRRAGAEEGGGAAGPGVVAVAITARPTRTAFWKSYIITMRPYLLFVSGITGLVGLALAPPVPMPDAWVLGLIFFLSYGFGQALTDCFQTDTDALSAPYRPMVRGLIHRRDVLLVSVAGLLFSGLVLAYYSVATLPLALMATAGLATYTYFKKRWWGGPWYNAWIVAVLALIGYLAGVGAAGASPSWNSTATWVLAAVFLGYANFVLVGYFKDVSADRATGYQTLPVAKGLTVSARASDVLAIAATTSAVFAIAPALVQNLSRGESAAVFVTLAAAAGAMLLGQLRLHGVRHDSMAYRAIAPTVHAYVLLLIAICLAMQPSWLVPLALFYALFAMALARRPAVEQI
jgi:NAD(P)-dependent dehydrogenase (short-subunit alcohol dehydrogenase family)/4-hydroxybenzoate polyprenyltransferase